MTDAEFNLCVDKYIKMVYRIAFHYFGNREDAEDIAQEVFLKLYSSDLTRDSEDEIKAWLIRVTSNACHSLFRKPFLRKRIDYDDYEWEQIPDNSTKVQDIVTHKVILDAVLSLPERYRILVYLYYYEGYSCSQIGKILQIKETTVQTRLSRARGKLRDMLEDSFPERGVCNEI